MKTGIQLIADERIRQIAKEGWSESHDDRHHTGDLATAASLYAQRPERRKVDGDEVPIDWPWADEWWKPCPDDRIRELVKAGALIAAEIDRLRRKAFKSRPPLQGGTTLEERYG